jgi:hypothetical protein
VVLRAALNDDLMCCVAARVCDEMTNETTPNELSCAPRRPPSALRRAVGASAPAAQASTTQQRCRAALHAAQPANNRVGTLAGGADLITRARPRPSLSRA